MNTYKNCDGVETPLDQGHYYELVDRIHCIREMWDSLINNHPACESVLAELSGKVQDAMGDAYQKAGIYMFDITEKNK